MVEGDIPTAYALDPRLRSSVGHDLRSSSMSPGAWTAEEDRILRACSELTSPSSGERLTWDEIVQVGFPHGTRSPLDCIARWSELEHAREQAASSSASSRSAHKGAWAPHEDAQLLALVEELGADKWVAVGKRMSTRTGKQCRERYHNHLDPSINKGPFTSEEDALITALHGQVGSKWAEIARALPGRPDNAIKNYFNTVINKRNKKRQDPGLNSPAPSSTSSQPGSPAVGLGTSLPFVPQSPRYQPYSTRSSVSLASGDSGISAPPLAASQSMPGHATRRRGSSASVMSIQRPHQLKLSMRTQSFDQESLSSLCSPPLPASPNDVFDRWTVGTPPATPDGGAIGHGQSHWGLFGSQIPGNTGRARSGSTASTSSQLRRALPPSPRLGPHTRASSSSLSAMSGSGLSVLTGVTTAPSSGSGRSSGSMPPTPLSFGQPSSGSGLLLGPLEIAASSVVEDKPGHMRRQSSVSLYDGLSYELVTALPSHAELEADDGDVTGHLDLGAWAAATEPGQAAWMHYPDSTSTPLIPSPWSESDAGPRYHHAHSSSSSSIASASSMRQHQLRSGSYFGGTPVLPLTPAMPDDAFAYNSRRLPDKAAVIPLDASDLLNDDGEQISIPSTHTIRARQTRSSRASIAPPRSRELAGPDLVNAYLQRSEGTTSPTRSDTGTVVGRKLRSSTRGHSS